MIKDKQYVNLTVSLDNWTPYFDGFLPIWTTTFPFFERMFKFLLVAFLFKAPIAALCPKTFRPYSCTANKTFLQPFYVFSLSQRDLRKESHATTQSHGNFPTVLAFGKQFQSYAVLVVFNTKSLLANKNYHTESRFSKSRNSFENLLFSCFASALFFCSWPMSVLVLIVILLRT